jgi:hypothetical protein
MLRRKRSICHPGPIVSALALATRTSLIAIKPKATEKSLEAAVNCQ